ncbi:3'-5' exoribonuclease HELZ2-like isoform X3 [Montipora capricornis]|uniref:3'-5' exoribonuclease HELZ2-like isoform X3 n=1 Tax=Montipora capricornis TaxID=246305 RepID=UPI0035F16356
MAEGGEESRLTWEDSEEIRQLMVLSMMGRYLNAVEDSDTAIGFAKENNNINLIVKSLFIKIKAIERLGDYVQALPLILLFKHLKPDCKEITRTLTDVKEKLSEKIKKDESVVREVLIAMLEFGTEEMERGNLTVAVEHFSELLDFLHFKFLPGVLLKRAECLLQLGRHSKAEEDCKRVLYFEPDNEEARAMMKRISQMLKNSKGIKQETSVSTMEKQEAYERNETDESTNKGDHQSLKCQAGSQLDLSYEGSRVEKRANKPVSNAEEKQKQCIEEEEDKLVASAETAPEETMQYDDVGNGKTKNYDKVENKRKKNKRKKTRKKEKKKAESQKAKNASSSDQKPLPNTQTQSSDEMSEEDNSQDTYSVTGDTDDISLGYFDRTTSENIPPFFQLPSGLPATFVGDEEDELLDGFTEVRRSRRPFGQFAKASTSKPASYHQNQLENQLSQTALGNRETLHSQSMLTPQSGSMKNIKLNRADNEMEGTKNQNTSKAPNLSTFEEFPTLENRLSQRSGQGSIHTSYSAVGHASKETCLQSSPPTTSQSQQSTTINSEQPYQGLPLGNYSNTGSFPVPSIRGVTTVSSFKHFSDANISLRSLNDYQRPCHNTIPDGVFVVCDHFLRGQTAPSLRVCTTCQHPERHSLLRFAVWNNIMRHWQAIRPYPAFQVPPKATLDVCRHFATHRPCPKEPCTFPHGKVESAMWTMERQGILPTPQQIISAERFKGMQSMSTGVLPTSRFPEQIADTQENASAASLNLSLSSENEFPGLGHVSLKNSTSNVPIFSTWSTPIEASERGLSQISSTSSTITPSHVNTEDLTADTQRCTTPDVTSQDTSENVVLKEGIQTDVIERINSSAWSSASTGRSTASLLFETRRNQGSQVSSFKNITEKSPDAVSDFRRIPKNVVVVCNHFLNKNRKRPASVNEKVKACKGCENRSKLEYAIWNDSNKEWQIIRPYPEKVPANVAFTVCRQYSMNVPCLRLPCSFAHGEDEQLMWTLEREGVLPTPRETLTGSPGKVTKEATLSNTRLQYRPSPPGVKNGAYKLCRSCYTRERCRFGRGCIFAHSSEEIKEWEQEYQRKEREKRMKVNQDNEEIVSIELTSAILKGLQENLVQDLAGVNITCTPPELSVKLQDSNDVHRFQWTFTLLFETKDIGCLRHVLLLYKYHDVYQLSEISVGCYEETAGLQSYRTCYTAKLTGFWYKAPEVKSSGRLRVSLTVSFASSLYGSFDQCVVFDFGKKTYLVQKLNADVHSEASTLSPSNVPSAAIWNERSVQVVRLVPESGATLQGMHWSRVYSLQENLKIPDEKLSRNNYKKIMHALLHVEEGFMKAEIARYTLNNAQLHAQWNIFDEMTGMKCAVDNELFGILHLQEEDALRPDDAAGRLLYRNVTSVWLQLSEGNSNKVYEAPVEKVESECVVLRLAAKICSELSLYDTCDVNVNAQFQLNRWPICEMHASVDRLTSGQLERFVFPAPRAPAVSNEVSIRWHWLLDKRLNERQKEVIKRIALREWNAPPLVVFGPFGTGKTFTLNQAVRLLVQMDKSHRILLCTHSHRAADIHVELLHKYLTEQNGTPAARPLRIYQPMRRLETASEVARNYCLIKKGEFKLPSRDDLVEHRVIITTLSTSKVLLDLHVFHGFFTYILIDEAAQALEPEALTPLVFAGPNTKVVFTGDHMQMSPEVYSPQARQLGLQKSLAERLFDQYSAEEEEEEDLRRQSNVLFLTENYRCHEEILKFPSYNFYGDKLIARGCQMQPAHPKYGPLLFFSARGREKKEHDNSYINLSEVDEVVKRVKEVANNWPTREWGEKKLSEIAVLSSYRYQVQAIRNRLRKERAFTDVKVDTIHNVQGEEFRVLFISTVRTFHTCKPQEQELKESGVDRQLYWEFLTDPKLLNTAVTRARCLVAVVGDPVSLCTVGNCRIIWKDFIKRCNQNDGLYGTTMAQLETEINAAIASIQLNPDAQSFVPKCSSMPATRGDSSPCEEHNAFSCQEAVETTGDEENGSNILQERKEEDNEIDVEQNKQDWSCSTMAANEHEQGVKGEKTEVQDEEEGENEAEKRNLEIEDLQDDFIDDETLLPRDIDEIILAFVRECERTKQLDDDRRGMFQDSEFPPLEASRSQALRVHSSQKVRYPSFKAVGELTDLCPEIRVVNGRVEVRLTNLGLYKSPSERAQRIIASAKEQEFLDPSVLWELLRKEPQKYIVCNLRLSPDNSQLGYAEVEDTTTPDIQIKGRVRQAFDRDKIVLELLNPIKTDSSKVDENEPKIQGKIVGVLEHIISPHERQFVCTTNYENPTVMVPINKSATKLVNLTDRGCEGIPIYKKDQNNRATKVRILKKEDVLSGKFLFVVRYLQWRRDCRYPLAMVVRELSRGEDLKSSMQISYAERGIRRAFKKDTLKYVTENFPSNWSIPKKEYSSRPKVDEAFTIDPPKSLDLDDALTIEEISLSTFLIGIHIADVSFFVQPDSPLDQEAFLRCTSYYPGEEEENIPMLPRELSENHCSLLPEKDRLAVSLFVTLDEEGRITKEPNVKRTIVTSCCRLNYTEAQGIIEKREENIRNVPINIPEKIRQLSSLAQKRRRERLGDSAFDHWQNEGIEDSFEAHEMIEEMMLLANEEVAKILSEKNPNLAPLRIQLPPKDQKLGEWIEKHRKCARLSFHYAKVLQGNSQSLELLNSEKTAFKIQSWVWSAIYEAVVSCDIAKVYKLICNEANHPQLAAARSHFRRIQSGAKFVCEGDTPPANIQHYSLGMRSYTQFTSPIRRYMDIVVHRRLLGLQSGSPYGGNMSKDEISKVCRRSNYMHENSRKFERDCKRIRMASRLQQRCQETRAFIESIDRNSTSLHILKPEDDHLAGKQKRLLLSHLSPVELKQQEDFDVTLKWRFRKYKAPDSNSSINGQGDESYCHSQDSVLEIPSDDWLRIMDAVRSKEESNLATIIKQIDARLKIKSPLREVEEPQKHAFSDKVGPYKHPHFGDSASQFSSDPNAHYYEKTLVMKKYDFFPVQLCPHMIRGILVPDIQLFKVNAHLNICIEHRRYPRESFAHTARHQASRERYETIDEYIQAWKPVLAMEAATGAVKENDGFVIEQVSIQWKKEKGVLHGTVSLPGSYCRDRQLEFHPGDLVCALVPYSKTETSASSEDRDKMSRNCCDEHQRGSDFWVGHCIIKEALEAKQKVKITMNLHQASSKEPDGLIDGSSHRSTLEIIHRILPQRRMYAALCTKLEDSSELVHAICKGEEPTEEKFGAEIPCNLSLRQHGFKILNQFQEAAVREALSKPFTLIQGPPGTGKTVTGVHIAYWFAERNRASKSYKIWEKGQGQTEESPKAPPQVIYCGPSNKAVDVVTEYLMKIPSLVFPSLKILRVYSDQVEQKEFPIPNTLKPARTTRSDDELKISNEKVRSVSLHHVIRSSRCPFGQELRQLEEGFAAQRRRGEKIGEEEAKEYRKVITQAERWALEESGAQIILCTCVTAGSPRIISSCDNIQECIVDECGMCMEPESLVPITCSGARQVVLIGDHKQLQPVIQDHVAKTLGLSVSMFERHSKRATMLKLQYRMHKGICKFPSKQFYDGELQTADVVKARDPSPITFWPAMIRQQHDIPIVFCHVEGQEESSPIATSESNEESKWNMKEVQKAVFVAKHIVNQYRPQVRMSEVVILSPYREQRSKISERLKGAYEEISVTTVTKSQGSEWDYVIISLVRSMKKDEIDLEPTQSWLQEHLGFLTDEHQMNVALTRARRGLCIIGNKHLLGMDKMWADLLQHYEENHCLVEENWPWS